MMINNILEHTRRLTFLQRFERLLKWSTIDKCIFFIIAVILPFNLIVALIFSYLATQPELLSLLGIRLIKIQVLWYWGTFLVYCLFVFTGLFIKKRSIKSNLYIHCVLQFLWITLAIEVYSIGTMTSPWIISILGVWIVCMTLFEPFPVILSVLNSIILLICFTIAAQTDIIPYAPFIRTPMVDGHPVTLSVIIQTAICLIFIATIILITGYLFALLRRHEAVLEQLSRTDTLTGLYNRRAFFEIMESELLRVNRYNRDLSLLMIDLDYFKRVNDEYGHQAGDEVLAAVASLLKKLARKSDITGRYGGEEFVILLTETDLAGAEAFAERCRSALETSAMSVNSNTKIHITASIGISTFSNVAEKTVVELIRQADSALYSAKNSGRNKIVTSPNILEP